MIKAADKWFPGYLAWLGKRPRQPVTDLVLTVCDHFEPFHHTDKQGALARMHHWQSRLPEVIAGQEDADGCLPRHTFFYPIEQYDREIIDELEKLARITGNEVEVHLHHQGETPEQLRDVVEEGLVNLKKHGFLPRDSHGLHRFAFIHGNWALDDANLDGRGCGVRGELELLRRAGCYADLTMPSAPHPTQCRMVNQVYYAQSHLHGRSHDCGMALSAEKNTRRDDLDHLLLIQGPLGIDLGNRKWGMIPRIENGDLTNNNPPSVRRAKVWLSLSPRVQGRAEWAFVKLHTHGALERNQSVLLTPQARQYHQALRTYAHEAGIRLHYASAREMTNILHAAEDGNSGDAGLWRDYIYQRPDFLSST